ncbi:tetratricopeptide repeat protein [Paenibacillus oralis]|uniref:Tetratricopeptide repeat protein n=1 Tax=Paenibacillus oralis TaxID=2490856 RepID=A0A3P3U222_9BACL|nr:tetratricopeptide repeat protein [Paenibacillus oralis]RRJ63906.1 tetratricopeptide repeat protein [Paenibacillus oralis]
MNIWKILGIDPTQDQSQIRKAYARMLKKYHPEDDPEGYQRLREAFDEAIKLAKRGEVFLDVFLDGEETEEEEDEASEEEGAEEKGETAEEEPNAESLEFPAFEEVWNLEDSRREGPPLRQSPEELVAEFIEEMDDLYLNFATRCNVSLWAELLNGDIIWELGNQSLLANRMLEYLNEHYFLPEAVWGLLDDAFGLEERSANDPSGFAEQYPKVCEYAFRSSPAATLGYSVLTGAEESDVEAYLHAREDFVTAMLAIETKEAREALERALGIYDRDAELLRLQIEFYRQNGELEQALSACDLWVRQFGGDGEVMIVRAAILLNIGRTDEAREELERIRPARPDDAEVLSLLGRCYIRLEHMDSAREAYHRMLRLYPGDIEAAMGLAKIDAYICGLPRPGKDRRKQMRQLKKEWGKHSLTGFLKKLASFLWLRKGLFFCIVLLHIMLPIAWYSNMEVSFPEYVKQEVFPSEPPLVTTAEELKSVPPGSAVRLKLTNAFFTGILEIEQKDADGRETASYMLQSAATQRNLMDHMTGYISQGKAGDITVLALTGYEESKRIHENHEIELQGIVQDFSGPALQSLREYWEGKQGSTDSSPPLVLYVNARDGVGSGILDIPVKVILFAIVLCLLYCRFILLLYRSKRFLLYK